MLGHVVPNPTHDMLISLFACSDSASFENATPAAAAEVVVDLTRDDMYQSDDEQVRLAVTPANALPDRLVRVQCVVRSSAWSTFLVIGAFNVGRCACGSFLEASLRGEPA